MPLLPLASIESLSERLGGIEPTSADGIRALASLEDASALIRAEGSKTWVDEDIPDIIEAICLAVAYRAYQNPHGAISASVGDVAVSYGGNSATAAGIYLTPAERRAVRRAAGKPFYGSIGLETPFMSGAEVLYAPAQGGGDMIPLGPVPWEIV